MQAFAEEVSPRARFSEGDEEKPVDEPSLPLIGTQRMPQRRASNRKNRDLKRIMLDGIPSNWAELLAYVILMCLCHLILRLAIVRSGLPSDQNVFKPADQFNNYLLLAHCSSTAYLLGSVALTHVLRTSYILLLMVSAFVFTLICEFPMFQSSLSYQSMEHWSIATIVGYSFAGCVLVVALCYQWALTKRWSVAYGRLYLSSIALVLAFHAILWALLPRGVHLHHWYCAWVYMFLLRSQDRFIIGAHAIATGIFLQGIASYGCASVLFNPR